MAKEPKGKAAPSYARKAAKHKQPQLPAELGEDVLRRLFGDEVGTDSIVQLSFSDAETGMQRKENVVTVRPREYVKTADRISSNIVEGFEKGEAEFLARKKTASGVEPIVTRVSFAYQNLDMLEGQGFTSLDKEVHDAVVSLYAAGNKVFSPAMVYRTMAGKSDSTFVPQEKIKEVSDSIYKCMGSVITIDASEEASLYGMEAQYHQNLLYAKSVTLKTKGWEVSAFLLMDEPVLYKYAKMKRQLFAVPLRVLDTPPNKTNDVIVLQGYLVRVVEGLRRPGSKAEPSILYATLYELLDCQNATKQKLLRVRNNLKTILDFWVDLGYIDGYSETIQNRTKHSVELQVRQEQYTLSSSD